MMGKTWGSESIRANGKRFESKSSEGEKLTLLECGSSFGLDGNFFMDLAAVRSASPVQDNGFNVSIDEKVGYGSIAPTRRAWMDIENAWDEEEEAEADDDEDDDEEEEEDDDFYGDDDEEFDEFDDDDDDDDEAEDEEE